VKLSKKDTLCWYVQEHHISGSRPKKTQHREDIAVSLGHSSNQGKLEVHFDIVALLPHFALSHQNNIDFASESMSLCSVLTLLFSSDKTSSNAPSNDRSYNYFHRVEALRNLETNDQILGS